MEYPNHLKEIQRNKKRNKHNQIILPNKEEEKRTIHRNDKGNSNSSPKTTRKKLVWFLIQPPLPSLIFIFLSFLDFQISQRVECQINISPFIPFLFQSNDVKISNKVAISPAQFLSLTNRRSHTYSTSESTPHKQVVIRFQHTLSHHPQPASLAPPNTLLIQRLFIVGIQFKRNYQEGANLYHKV